MPPEHTHHYGRKSKDRSVFICIPQRSLRFRPQWYVVMEFLLFLLPKCVRSTRLHATPLPSYTTCLVFWGVTHVATITAKRCSSTNTGDIYHFSYYAVYFYMNLYSFDPSYYILAPLKPPIEARVYALVIHILRIVELVKTQIGGFQVFSKALLAGLPVFDPAIRP